MNLNQTIIGGTPVVNYPKDTNLSWDGTFVNTSKTFRSLEKANVQRGHGVSLSAIKGGVRDTVVSSTFYIPPEPEKRTSDSLVSNNAVLVNNRSQEYRIIGGEDVNINNIGRLKWAGFLSDSVSNKPFCGVSLIAPTLVLSATHCMQGRELKDVALFFSGVDASDLSSFQKRVPIKSYYINDIALFEIQPLEGVQPITLNSNPSVQNALPKPIATAIGWGATIYEGDMSTILQRVDLPLVDDHVCKSTYNNEIDVTTDLCAGGISGKDACQGDSGGPLYIDNPEWQTPILVGLSSWGIGCGTSNPGVWSKVNDSTLDWIYEMTGQKLVGRDPLNYEASGYVTHLDEENYEVY